MAVISIDIGSHSTRIQDAFGLYFNYQATLPGGGANPESKGAFTKRMVAEWVKDIVKAVEANAAADAARTTAAASADAIAIT